MKRGDVIATQQEGITLQAKVNWVVEGEAGITYTEPDDWKGGSNVIQIRDWEVIEEAIPTYQSSVEGMSDDALRESIDRLRRTRVSTPPKVRVRGKVKKEDPIAIAFSKMSPQKKKEIMEKLRRGE